MYVKRKKRAVHLGDDSLERNKPRRNKIRPDLKSSEFVRYVCEYCQIQFDAKPNLINHQRELHQAEKEEEAKAIEALYCKACDRQFKNKSAAYHHFKLHHKKKFMCAKCDDIFPSMHELEKHLETHRKRNEREKNLIEDNANNQNKISQGTGGSRVKCNECDVELKYASCMTSHWRTVHNVRLSCTVCNLKFSKKSLLSEHEQESHKEFTLPSQQNIDICEEFTCRPCDKKFTSKQSFNGHIRKVHLKQYSCDKCEKQYASRRDLNNHLKVHGKREENVVEGFQCDQCGKQFDTKRNLTNHVKCHSTFRCSECKRVYRNQVAFLSYV